MTTYALRRQPAHFGYADMMEKVYSLMGIAESIPQMCMAHVRGQAKAQLSDSHCMFAEYLLPNLRTPVFLFEVCRLNLIMMCTDMTDLPYHAAAAAVVAVCVRSLANL